MILDGDPGPVLPPPMPTRPGRWILRRFNETVASCTAKPENIELARPSGRDGTNLFETEYHDWHIEVGTNSPRETIPSAAPPRLYILKKVLTGVLQPLHPIMPFIIEKLRQHLE